MSEAYNEILHVRIMGRPLGKWGVMRYLDGALEKRANLWLISLHLVSFDEKIASDFELRFCEELVKRIDDKVWTVSVVYFI